ncbi:MAG TPA: hypothetical protein DCE41_35910 [Cytophagales bacterium]|nr:hypothetical protein [Cytophagales bacterium]HAA18311.1 hypothetical protein [Cytophagales bacterium]HAP63869.1 hypothetical protein [Cytophagales bacterium]
MNVIKSKLEENRPNWREEVTGPMVIVTKEGILKECIREYVQGVGTAQDLGLRPGSYLIMSVVEPEPVRILF